MTKYTHETNIENTKQIKNGRTKQLKKYIHNYIHKNEQMNN